MMETHHMMGIKKFCKSRKQTLSLFELGIEIGEPLVDGVPQQVSLLVALPLQQ